MHEEIWITFVDDWLAGFFKSKEEAQRLADVLKELGGQRTWVDDRQVDQTADDLIRRYRSQDRITKEMRPIWEEAFGK